MAKVGSVTTRPSPVTYPAGSTTLLVRVAINNDGIYEGPESFTLKAQTGGITAYGIGNDW